MKLAEHLKKYRQENHYTQADLANLLFVSKQTISKWENEKGLPDIGFYPKLANLLGVSIDELMDHHNKEDKIISKKPKLIIIFLTITMILIIILIILLIYFKPEKIKERTYIKETENLLNIKLPKVKTFNYLEFDTWFDYDKYYFPAKMYSFTFKKTITFVDDTYVESFSNQNTNFFPALIEDSLQKFNLFKLVCQETKAINIITNPYDDILEHYCLYCLDLNNNRLCVYEFEI